MSLKTLGDVTPSVALHPVYDRQRPRIITEQVTKFPFVRFILKPFTRRKPQFSMRVRPGYFSLAVLSALTVPLERAVARDLSYQRPALELPILHPLIYVCRLTAFLGTKVSHDIEEVAGRIVAAEKHRLVQSFWHGKVRLSRRTPAVRFSCPGRNRSVAGRAEGKFGLAGHSLAPRHGRHSDLSLYSDPI